METCNICCDNINKGNKKEVKCPYCEFSSCLVCFRTYLMDNSRITADCMNCHRELSMEFISEVTPKVFHSQEYRNKRAEDLLSREKSLLPATQHLVEARKERERREKIINDLNDELKYLKERSREIREEIFRLRTEPIDGENGAENGGEKERKKFIMGCPAENCRGFLSQAWKCGTCDIYACPHCRCIKGAREDAEHVCDKEAVETAKLLAQDTKCCPSCATPIYKIAGCDQMYCTSCHTPFSWKTGQIVTGVIHNPHFYEWQRQQNGGVAPRVPGDVPCGGLPWINTVRAIMVTRKQEDNGITRCHRMINHIREIEMIRYPDRMGVTNNSDLRVMFLMHIIDEETWKRNLKMRQKRAEKDREIHQILEMFHISATDIFNTYVSGNILTIQEPLEQLRTYTNRNLLKIKHKYTVKVPYLEADWKLESK